MFIKALRCRPSHLPCYVMLCGLLCFVCSLLNISSIVWLFGNTSASTETKRYNLRTVFRETCLPGKVTIRETSFRETSFREIIIRESNHAWNDRIPCKNGRQIRRIRPKRPIHQNYASPTDELPYQYRSLRSIARKKKSDADRQTSDCGRHRCYTGCSVDMRTRVSSATSAAMLRWFDAPLIWFSLTLVRYQIFYITLHYYLHICIWILLATVLTLPSAELLSHIT